MRRSDHWFVLVLVIMPLLTGGCGGDDDPTSPQEDPNWHALPGLNNLATELTVYDGDLIAGGFFTRAGSVSARGIARWDGTSWNPLGQGLNGGPLGQSGVLSMTSYQGNLIVAGLFTQAGDVSVENIAQWDGTTWSALGSGIQASSFESGPFCMAVHNGSLYVGGTFLLAGSIPVRHIARWDGTSWHAVGEGVAGTSEVGLGMMALYDGDLVVGGNFDSIDEVPAGYIARWDGLNWDSLGAGIDGHPDSTGIVAASVLGDHLFASGVFRMAGDVAASNVARWDGSAWNALGSGTNNRVEVLSPYGADLVAGGTFTRAGQGSVRFIARWNGTSWSPLGQGVGGGIGGMTVVSALAVYDGSLIVGGNFTKAGGKNVGYVARWED